MVDYVERVLPDPEATEILGRCLARAPLAGCVMALQGDLGVGKSALARAVIHAMGYVGNVKSPTYTLVEPYTLPGLTILHLDLYRLADPAELEYLGVREAEGSDTLWLVEWPSRGQGYLPPFDVEIDLRVAGEGRLARIMARSERGLMILNNIR
jgi:tRNA threonylcarbamoyl adenosine modification protein YjeE